jgi:hypothetical protein
MTGAVIRRPSGPYGARMAPPQVNPDPAAHA